MLEPVTPITKSWQTRNNRQKQLQRNKTRITAKVRKEVLRRVEERYGHERACERCGRVNAYSYEMAHLEGAGQLGRGDQPWNIVLLCAPSVNSDTCHHWADHTREGREWRRRKRVELMEYYRGRGESGNI